MDNIISKHQVAMDQAIALTKLSKCASLKVGCIITNERDKIISSGVNGTISGDDNCCDLFEGSSTAHSQWSQDNEIHAEMNAILELARNGSHFNRFTIYTTHSPCFNCLKHIMGLRTNYHYLDKIIYNEVYKRTTDEQLKMQKDYCKRFGVDLLSLQVFTRNAIIRKE
jgi:dCMP deaminase